MSERYTEPGRIIPGRRRTAMRKWYATITREDGTQFDIGGYSEKEIRKDLNQIQRTGFADLEKASVEIYTVEIEA